MSERLNLYQISAILDLIYNEGNIDLPAIPIINKTIKALGYRGKFGINNGRPAFGGEE